MTKRDLEASFRLDKRGDVYVLFFVQMKHCNALGPLSSSRYGIAACRARVNRVGDEYCLRSPIVYMLRR